MIAHTLRTALLRPRPAGAPSTAFAARDIAPPPLAHAATFPLVGTLGGTFGGLLGIGGGSVISPLLLLFSRLRPARVSGTTLATVLTISIVGSAAYASLGHLDLGMAWPIALGSVAGSVLGALTAKRLSLRLMVAIFVVILPYFALKEFWPSLAAPAIATNLGSLGFLGLVTGFIGGLLGISGASLVVPSLVGFFLIGHHAAQGIAIGVALADSAAGAFTHARAGNIDYRALTRLAPLAFVAALAGAIFSSMLPVPVLRALFGTLMFAIWAIMLVRLLRMRWLGAHHVERV